MKQVVARYQDGRVLKGLTNDFLPTKDRFHLLSAGSPPGTAAEEVLISSLKAVFFVHDLQGSPEHKKINDFDNSLPGRKIRVVFKDGEVLVGTTNGYQPGRPGSFSFLPTASRTTNVASSSARRRWRSPSSR